MTATEESALHWRSIANEHDLDTAMGMITEAVIAEIEALPRCWARDVAMKSTQSVQWNKLTEALRVSGHEH